MHWRVSSSSRNSFCIDCWLLTRSHRLIGDCSVFTADISDSLGHRVCKVHYYKRQFVIFPHSMSVLQAIEAITGQESKNPLVNGVVSKHVRKVSLRENEYITFLYPEQPQYNKKSKGSPYPLDSSVHIFLMKIQSFITSLWQKGWDKKWLTNCAQSCPILMRNITRDAHTKRMKL